MVGITLYFIVIFSPHIMDNGRHFDTHKAIVKPAIILHLAADIIIEVPSHPEVRLRYPSIFFFSTSYP